MEKRFNDYTERCCVVLFGEVILRKIRISLREGGDIPWKDENSYQRGTVTIKEFQWGGFLG